MNQKAQRCIHRHQPTSRFSNLCFRDCNVCDSCAKVSAGPLDTSPIVFLVPDSFLLPPGRASPGSTPLWLSQRANFEVSSLIVSFWLIIVSFCCRTVSRSCMTVVFRSSPGTLFCSVAAQMSTSLGTEVQMNWVCPPKSWEKVCQSAQESRRSVQQNPPRLACIMLPGSGSLLVRFTNVAWCARARVPSVLMLRSSCASRFYSARPVLRREALPHHDPEGRESLCPRLNVCAGRVTFRRVLLSASRRFNLLSLRLFVISGFVLFIQKKKKSGFVGEEGCFCVVGGKQRQLCVCFVVTDPQTQSGSGPAHSAPRTAPLSSSSRSLQFDFYFTEIHIWLKNGVRL